MIMRGIVGVVGSVICFYLARAFWSAVLINGAELPGDAEILTSEGDVHVCDASACAARRGRRSSSGLLLRARLLFAALGVTHRIPGRRFRADRARHVPVHVRSVRWQRHRRVHASSARGDIDDDPAAHGLSGAASEVAHDIEDGKKGR